MTMMGGPIDPRRNPTQVNALAMRKSQHWFENHVIFKVPAAYPGYLRSVYPGFLQHAGFVAMNPDRHLKSHWDYYLDLVKGDQEDAESHREFYDEYNAVIDLPAEYYLDTIKIVFKQHQLPDGKWRVRGQLVQPEDIRSVALVHDRRRARRHFGQRSDPSRARPVQEHPQVEETASDGRAHRPLRHLQRTPLAREHRAGDREIHSRERLATLRAETGLYASIRQSMSACPSPAGGPNRRPAAADAVHEMRLRRLPALRRGNCGGEAEINQCPPGGVPASSAGAAAGSSGRCRSTPRTASSSRSGRGHRREPVHRLHAVHPCLPGRRDRGCGQSGCTR